MPELGFQVREGDVERQPKPKDANPPCRGGCTRPSSVGLWPLVGFAAVQTDARLPP